MDARQGGRPAARTPLDMCAYGQEPVKDHASFMPSRCLPIGWRVTSRQARKGGRNSRLDQGPLASFGGAVAVVFALAFRAVFQAVGSDANNSPAGESRRLASMPKTLACRVGRSGLVGRFPRRAPTAQGSSLSFGALGAGGRAGRGNSGSLVNMYSRNEGFSSGGECGDAEAYGGWLRGVDCLFDLSRWETQSGAARVEGQTVGCDRSGEVHALRGFRSESDGERGEVVRPVGASVGAIAIRLPGVHVGAGLYPCDGRRCPACSSQGCLFAGGLGAVLMGGAS